MPRLNGTFVDFALMVEPHLGGAYDDLVDLARWAETNGLASFTRSDHYYAGREPRPPATDAFATLAGLARDTSSIRLCVLVTPITFRHPAVIAKMAATIDQMSGGRLDLGVGTGWMELEHDAFGLPFPPWAERFARLEETLEYLKAAFGEGGGSFEGEYYSIDAEAYPKPAGPMPIIIGGSGPKKTPTLAGQFANEYNHFLGPDDRMKARWASVRAAAADAGRDPDSITFSAVDHVITGATSADYTERVGEMAAARDTGVDDFVAMLDDRGVLHGPADRVAERVAHLETLGISKFYLQFFNQPTIEEIETVWRAVHG